MLMSNEVIVRINPYTEVLPYTYIYSIYIKGGTVHRCHGSVCKLVRGSRIRFDTILVQQEHFFFAFDKNLFIYFEQRVLQL